MSLLDDVSIVVTPNAYKAGRLYGVLPVPTEGSELVTNGDFATDSDWTKGTGWTISGGTANVNTTSFTDLYQTVGTSAQKTYKVTYTVSNYVSGSVKLLLGYGSSPELPTFAASANGTYEIIQKTNITNPHILYISVRNATTQLSIDNVSVKEWTASDMDVTRATAATRVDENGLVNYAEVLGSEKVTNGSFNTTIPIGNNGSGWAKVIAGSCTVEYDNGGVKLTQASVGNQDCKIYARTVGGSDNLLTVGKQYKVTYEVLSNNNSTVLKYYRGGTYLQIDHTVGTHTFYYEQESNQLSIFWNLTANSDITLDNISIKESDRNNVPRIDYTGGGCPHILAEPQRTNIITYSEDLSQWTIANGTLTPNATVSPDGTQNAGRVVFNNTGLDLKRTVTVVAGQTYTISFYIKLESGTGLQGRFYDNSNSTNIEYYTYTSQVQGTEWSRVTRSVTAPSGCTEMQIWLLAASSSLVTASFWGAQFEAGSYATSYIPTSGSAITRNQDQFTREGIGSLINDSEGVLFLEVARLSSADNTSIIWSISDGSNSNAVSLYYASTGVKVDIFNSTGTKTLQHSMSLTEQANFNKLAIKYKSNDIALWVNGNEVATNTDAISLSGLNELISSYGSGSFNFFGKIKQLQVYDTALTDTQLAALTS